MGRAHRKWNDLFHSKNKRRGPEPTTYPCKYLTLSPTTVRDSVFPTLLHRFQLCKKSGEGTLGSLLNRRDIPKGGATTGSTLDPDPVTQYRR